MPFAGTKIRLPLRAIASEVSGTVTDDRSTALLRLDPPGHDVVVAGRRISFPIQEIVSVPRRLGHVHVKGHIGVGAFFDGHSGSANLHAQLLSVENVVLVDGELARVFSLQDDVGDNLDISRRRVLTASAGRVPLTEVAG